MGDLQKEYKLTTCHNHHSRTFGKKGEKFDKKIELGFLERNVHSLGSSLFLLKWNGTIGTYYYVVYLLLALYAKDLRVLPIVLWSSTAVTDIFYDNFFFECKNSFTI